ncbi:EAL domain-containing protein [Lacticaseibacillus sp. GG6-2]
MIRLWGQPKYDATSGKLAGYELFLREQQEANGRWLLPKDFSQFSPQTMANLIEATLETLPKDFELVSFNLDQEQFIDPAYVALLVALQDKLTYDLVIELTERRGTGNVPVDAQMLIAAAKRFEEVGLVVCLDDVGTGANTKALVSALDPYVAEYKFALQNVRGKLSVAEIVTAITYWRIRAQQQHKRFALEGFEESTDIQLIRRFSPNLVQGYYFGRPHVLPIAADFDAQ